MERRARILITGAAGMVGSQVARHLAERDFTALLTPSRRDLDLRDASRVDRYFCDRRPEYVFMIAAVVGGISANQADPVRFLEDNLRIQINLFKACHDYGVRKALFLGSSCIYPRACPQPMREESFLTGPLEPTNEAYAVAKIAGIKLAEYYHRQFGMMTVCPLPCNIYGTNDHFDLDRSHVLSALVKRFTDAKDEGLRSVTLWGTGRARREFIHVEDVSRALLLLMDVRSTPEIINLGTGADVTIQELAHTVAEIVGYSGTVDWDPSKPDGMPRKCLDVSKLKSLGFSPEIGLRGGIQRTVDEYRRLKAASVSP
jgi:GDP-L-fucose synthase